MKNLLNLGKALSKAEQKSVFGGQVSFDVIHKCGIRCTEGTEGCKKCSADGSWRKKGKIPTSG